jgi:hypothetical protein
MAKAKGSFKPLVRGVSQQSHESRLDGQVGEQVNMLSDPVHGLVRRPGTKAEWAYLSIPGLAAQDDMKDWVARDVTLDATKYTVLHRRKAGTHTSNLYMWSRTTKTHTPVVESASAKAILAQGVSGIAAVGKLLIMAGKEHVVQANAVERWNTEANRGTASIWVRGGAYSRTYKITLIFDLGTVTATYTTPSASYQGTLTTADIPYTATDYQKQVNDRVNAFNSASTNWLGTAAAAVQPQAIAGQLVTALAAYVTAGQFGVTSVNGSVCVINGTWKLQSVSVSDSGDGSLLRAVHQTVKDISLLAEVALPGKIVKIKPDESTYGYYMKAVGTLPASTNFQPVTWAECAGTDVDITTAFAVGTVLAGTLYVCGSITELNTITGNSFPTISSRLVGDSDSNPAPYFVGRKITYLGNFQDRVVVAAGGVLNFSQVGDYLNFFRNSVLTVADSDPVEAYASGGEDDVIRHSVIFDKNLLLFGDSQQYVVGGSVPLTPSTSQVVQSSAHKQTTNAVPLVNGDLVFYSTETAGSTQVSQIAVGNYSDTSNSNEVTQQITTYIEGTPIEMAAMTSPDIVVVRSSGRPNSIYVFRYIDSVGQQQRLMDSWSRFDYSPLLGPIVGMTLYNKELFLFYARPQGAGCLLSVDTQSLLAKPTIYPHLDSMRQYATGSLNQFQAYASMSCAFVKGLSHQMMGGSISEAADLVAEFPTADSTQLMVGMPFDSYVELTNPYPKDRNGEVVPSVRCTVTKLTFTYENTGAFAVRVVTDYSNAEVLRFSGRNVGAASSIIGGNPVVNGTAQAFIGRETRDYRATVSSVNWLPLSIKGVEWVGQVF